MNATVGFTLRTRLKMVGILLKLGWKVLRVKTLGQGTEMFKLFIQIKQILDEGLLPSVEAVRAEIQKRPFEPFGHPQNQEQFQSTEQKCFTKDDVLEPAHGKSVDENNTEYEDEEIR